MPPTAASTSRTCWSRRPTTSKPGTSTGRYDLIMVDEFQDASRARARLVRGLVKTPGRFLLAVGDDWQSINRFAGADLSVMTNFEAWFGRGHQLALTTTFRCTQTICDVARTFVSKNPNQFNKPMRSAHHDPGPPITVIRADDVAGALASYLDDLSAAVADGSIPSERSGTVSVDVLGRYGFERDVLPRHLPSNLHVTFRTVHGSKGLEADYIVIPGMTTGTYGFPSNIADDPVLDLAMPAPESFRARRGTPPLLRGVDPGTPSGHAHHPAATDVAVRNRTPRRPSRDRHRGQRHPRRGLLKVWSRDDGRAKRARFGPFLGCSTFPACKNKRDLQKRPTWPSSAH